MKLPYQLSGDERKNFLEWGSNKYGDIKVSKRLYGDKYSKWVSVLDICHDEKEIWRLEQATDRTLFPCEIVLDIDLRKNETKVELRKRFEGIIRDLIKDQYRFAAYGTGGNGYHIHLLFYELVERGESLRKEIRDYFIRKYGADTQLKSDKHMILIEYTPNRKTGVPKHLIIYNSVEPPEPLLSHIIWQGDWK